MNFLFCVIFSATIYLGDFSPINEIIDSSFSSYEYYRNNGFPKYTEKLKRDISLTEVGNFLPVRIYLDDSQLSSFSVDAHSCDVEGKSIILDEPKDKAYTCTANDVMDPVLLGYVKYGILPAALAVIENLLKVNRTSAPLRYNPTYIALHPKCINGHTIPANQINGTGLIKTDFVLFPTVRPRLLTEKSPLIETKGKSYIVTGSPCQFSLSSDGRLSRPLAGWLNFNSASPMLKNIDVVDPFFFRYLTRITVQGLLQTFGISIELSSNFKSPTNDYYYEPISSSPPMITTPRITYYARNHFGCSSLPGVPLDNTIPRFDAGVPQFFSREAVGNEISAPWNPDNGPAVLSVLTIALIEDSGWYRSNYSLAEPFHWGYQQGCSFVTARCSPTTWSSPGYWCSKSFEVKCSADRTSFGFCNLQQFDYALPPNIQFNSLAPNEAGADPLYGNCPFYTPSRAWCTNSRNPFRTGDPLGVGEVFSDSSSCFDIETNTSEVACYPTRCSPYSTLEINVNGNWHSCPERNKIVVNVPSGVVTIRCPVANSFCVVKSFPLNFTYDVAGDATNYPPPPNDSTTEPINPPPPPRGPAPLFDFSGNARWYFTDYEACFWTVLVFLCLIVFGAIAAVVYCCCCNRDILEKEKKELEDILKTSKKPDEYMEMASVNKLTPKKDSKPTTPEGSASAVTSSSEPLSQSSQPSLPHISSSEVVVIKNENYVPRGDEEDESV